MIDGAHVIIYSRDTEADKAFFRDVLKFPHVDVATAGCSSGCRRPTSRCTNRTTTTSIRFG